MSGVLLGNPAVLRAIRRVAQKASLKRELRRYEVQEIEQTATIKVWQAESKYDAMRSDPEKFAVLVAWRAIASMIRRERTLKAVSMSDRLNNQEPGAVERLRRRARSDDPAEIVEDTLDTEAILARLRANDTDAHEVLRIAERRSRRSRRARAQPSTDGDAPC